MGCLNKEVGVVKIWARNGGENKFKTWLKDEEQNLFAIKFLWLLRSQKVVFLGWNMQHFFVSKGLKKMNGVGRVFIDKSGEKTTNQSMTHGKAWTKYKKAFGIFQAYSKIPSMK